MTAFHHAVREAGAVFFCAQKPPSLLEPDIELLEVAGGELSQRNMPQLRDDVLVDTVFVVRLSLGADRRLALRLIPAVHPSPEGHIRLGALRFRASDAVPQRLKLFLTLPFSLSQYILCLGQTFLIAANDVSALPAAILSPMDAAVPAATLSLCHKLTPLKNILYEVAHDLSGMALHVSRDVGVGVQRETGLGVA